MEWIGISSLTGIIALVFVVFIAKKVMRQDPGTPLMVSISDAIHEGAMAFLKREYRAIAIFAIIVAALLAVGLKGQGWQFSIATAVSYLIGAACSLIAGYVGLSISTRANTRTAQAATKGFNQAMSVAFPGGGIYTKAAEVGADLVGKVEAGIPEDDPRNPATIADNVGDNVGDVAGMGADLYESYCGSILATMALGAALAMSSGADVLKMVLAPMVVAGIGIILSIAGMFMVRCKEDATQKNLLRALLLGTLGSSVLILIVLAGLAMTDWISWGIFGSVVSGLIAGVVIGQFTEHYTH